MTTTFTTTHEERAYRRGCHQAVARLSDRLAGCSTLAEARQFIGRVEQILADMREDPGPVPNLLDELDARMGQGQRIAEAEWDGYYTDDYSPEDTP